MSMRSVPLVVVAACTALVGCGSPPARTPSSVSVRRGVSVTALRYDVPSPVNDFTVCTPGVPLLATGGGLHAAGVDTWVVEPGWLPFTSVGCDDASRPTGLLGGRRLVRFPKGLGGGTVEVLATLPPGKFRLLTTSDGAHWLWGQGEDGAWHLLRHGREGLQTVWRGARRIGAIAPAGSEALVAAIGKDVLLFRPGGQVARVTQLANVDGLASARDGALYASTPDGILELRREGERIGATWLARGLHGPLRLRLDTLFVLWREGKQITRLALGRGAGD